MAKSLIIGLSLIAIIIVVLFSIILTTYKKIEDKQNNLRTIFKASVTFFSIIMAIQLFILKYSWEENRGIRTIFSITGIFLFLTIELSFLGLNMEGEKLNVFYIFTSLSFLSALIFSIPGIFWNTIGEKGLLKNFGEELHKILKDYKIALAIIALILILSPIFLFLFI